MFWEMMCAELEDTYPECDDEYVGEMPCDPSPEHMDYYMKYCEDEEEGSFTFIAYAIYQTSYIYYNVHKNYFHINQKE